MAISADTLLDRLHLKQQVQRWRLIAILAVFFALVFITEKQFPGSRLEPEFIARLNIEGIIMEDDDRDKLIKQIKENPRVKAVIVRLDTPGGSAVGGEELYLQLRDLAKVKPVVAVMRSLTASAGYMTALGTDYIFAREGTITGSIGVMLQTFEVTELAEKIGLNPITVKSAPLKGSPSPLEKPSPEAVASLQAVIDDFYKVFIDMVSERRNIPREEVRKIADGRVYSGAAALKLGLIDAIGGEADAHAWLTEKHKISARLPIKEMKPESKDNGMWEHFSRTLAGKFFAQSSGKLDGLNAIWHPWAQIQ